jgi:hypothetical protein
LHFRCGPTFAKRSEEEKMSVNGLWKKFTVDSEAQAVKPRRQLSVASRLTLMTTSVLFWVVGNTLPDSEWLLKLFSKIVAVLSFLNYATWTGRRHAIGVLDYIAVHLSVIIFCFKLWGRSPAVVANVVGIVATYTAWRNKRQAKDQVFVHLIALFNLFAFGMMVKN